MTSNCINSLMDSEQEEDVSFEVILIESNAQIHETNFSYPHFVKMLIPTEKFNFHQYLNIGIKESSGEMIALCNNDLLFEKQWMTAILKVKSQHSDILSFSPIDYNSQDIQKEQFNRSSQEYILGYNIRTHIAGWCLILNKELIDKVGLLDERFPFYYADNDYAMTLRKHSVKHALVLNSEVHHLEGMSTNKKKEKEFDYRKNGYINLPKYLFTEGYSWILRRQTLLDGHLTFHQKWGSPRSLSIKNKLSGLLSKAKLDGLVKVLYCTSKHVPSKYRNS